MDLVERLSANQPIELVVRPRPALEHIKASVDRAVVQILFPNTKGGTELSVPLDVPACDWSDADLACQTGRIRLEGNLNLDYVPVRFVGVLDLATCRGEGALRRLDTTTA